jgi:sulfonate transport system ATP-binding protein
MISVDLDEKRFGQNTVLRDVRFDLHARETLAITGPSGVGKTTLLRIIAGLDHDFDGKVSVKGRMAMIFQEPTLLPWRSVRDNISLVAHVPGAEAERVLDSVGLADKADHLPSQLSLGQQRRLALARAFAVQPDVLLMDEPFVSLDNALIEEMLVLTEKLRDQRPLATIFVTHSQAEAERLATRSLTLGAP